MKFGKASASVRKEKSPLKRVFDIFDKDKDGLISANDLKRIIESYGKTTTNEELYDMIEYARKQTIKRNSLSFDQFQRHISNENESNPFAETARLLYCNEDFASRMLHLREKEGFICDMDGVIYRGGAVIDGVNKFLDWIEDEKKKILFLTNNSKCTAKQLQQKLESMGLFVGEEHFITSAQTTAAFLLQQKPNKGKCYIIGGEGLHEAMAEVGFEECANKPDYVILGDADEYYHKDICKATQLVHGGARLICTNSDVTHPIENGSVIPGGRAWVSIIEVATGKKAYFPSIPNPLMMRNALSRLNLHSSEAAIIGDNMETDILSGIESNLSPVLVLTGVTKESHLENYPYKPYLVLDSVADIPTAS